MSLIDGPRLAPAAGGAPRQLVVFLHGYGADGNDLIGLGREWANALPHAAFVSPDAPEPCAMAPTGRQWFNLTFGDLSDDRAGNPWDINTALPGIDVETVALHENGHSLELGHFGPPPAAVLNPIYAGQNVTPRPADHAGMCAVWASWPNP